MACYITIFEVVAAPILERRVDYALRPSVSASHIVGILMDHRMLLAGIDRANAAHAERAFMLARHVVRRVERRAVTKRIAGHIHQQRHRVRTVKLASRAQAYCQTFSSRNQSRRSIYVGIRTIHLAHSSKAIGIIAVEAVGRKHIVHLAYLRRGKFRERHALVRNIRLRTVVESHEHINRRRRFWRFWIIVISRH